MRESVYVWDIQRVEYIRVSSGGGCRVTLLLVQRTVLWWKARALDGVFDVRILAPYSVTRACYRCMCSAIPPPIIPGGY